MKNLSLLQCTFARPCLKSLKNREPFFFIIFIYSVQTQSEVSAFILFHGSLPGFTFTFRFSLLSELESLVLKISL